MAQKIPGNGWATVFQRHPTKTLAIPTNLHKESVKRLLKHFHEKLHIANGLILLDGGNDQPLYDTDCDQLFRQDSWFQYLFGVKEPGFTGIVDIQSKKVILFIPRLPEEYKLWCGKIHPPVYFQTLYGVDDVLYTDEKEAWLFNYINTSQNATSSNTLQSSDKNIEINSNSMSYLYVLDGINSDSGYKSHSAILPDIPIIQARINKTILHHALSSIRVLKSPQELIVIQYSAYVASMAHVEVMRIIQPNISEYELESKFIYEISSKGGCRHTAYISICACGPNAAVLHYGHASSPNNDLLLDGGIALLDMGANYHGYMSDITCSYPINGKFNDDQKAIYTGVLNAQLAVMAYMKPGVSWINCHLLAEYEILKVLISIGILYNGTIEEMMSAEIGAIFFPHGLGHLLGCDVHDVGGYIHGTPDRPTREGLKKLRTARILEEGMVLTVEPGCYFIDYLLQQALQNPKQAQYLNITILSRFQQFGGIRLEDDVVVTATGIENYTLCPRSIHEVESVLSGGPWPPEVDTMPSLYRKWVKLSSNCQYMEAIHIPLHT